MMESGYFNNGNFREYSYFAGEFCSLETGIPGGPETGVVTVTWPTLEFYTPLNISGIAEDSVVKFCVFAAYIKC